MQYLARIISKQKLPKLFNFVDITTDINKVNNYMPTLIIGKKLAENIFGEAKIHVLNRKIDENIYWTYSILEKRDINEKDVNKFYDIVIKAIQSKITYLFFNLFIEDFERLKRFIKFLLNKENKIVCIDNNYIYIYYDKYVFGFCLEQSEFFGVNRKKIISQLKENINNTIFNANNIDISTMSLKILENHRYLLPYLYSLMHKSKQNNIYYI